MYSRKNLCFSDISIMAIFAEITEYECIVESTCAIYIQLPIHCDNPSPSLASFRQRLKTFLFSHSYPDIVS